MWNSSTNVDDVSEPIRPAPADDAVLARRREIGKRLRDKRIEAALSQEALAERTGLERKAISRAETGTHAISLDGLIRWAHALDLNERDLLG